MQDALGLFGIILGLVILIAGLSMALGGGRS